MIQDILSILPAASGFPVEVLVCSAQHQKIAM